MGRDRVFGLLILVASILSIVVYGILLFTYPLIMLQLTAFIAVLAILAILAWIGWTMATTPPPKPIEPGSEVTPNPSE